MVSSLHPQSSEYSTSNCNTLKPRQTGQILSSVNVRNPRNINSANETISAPSSPTRNPPPDLPLCSSSASNHHPHQTISSALPFPTFILATLDISPAGFRKASLRMSMSNPPDTAVFATASNMYAHTQRSARTLLQQQCFCTEHRYPQDFTQDP